MKRLLIIILLPLVLSCEETIDWQLKPEDVRVLVVDGKFTNERTPHKVTLSQTSQTEIGGFDPLTGAIVVISDGETHNYLTENTPGNYFTEPGVQGVFGKPYYLYIRYNQKEFLGTSYMVPVQPLEALNYIPHPEYANFFKLVFNETPDASMIEYDIDWSHLAGCPDPDSCKVKQVQYTLKSIDVNEIFKPDKEQVFFPRGSRVIRKKYSLNQNQQEFYRSLMMETEWQGGWFDVKRGNVKTNMSEGAVGYFLVSTVVTDTTYIE